MKRKRIEAWACEHGGEFYFLAKSKSVALKECDTVADLVPLVRYDPKAEAVLREALRLRDAWDAPPAEWVRAVDSLGDCVDAYRAAKRKVA